ncbi:hypothetical protein SDC9_209737 [bioreactor metagenome]|uniref:Uncharacterized protein n=1 Tax=bioreactor metagenome TaxID=1076179 RepID=A0A645JEH7_9ZZZZ
MTIVIATHKSEEIAEFADRVLVLQEGRAAAFDTPGAIFADRGLLDRCWIRPPQVSALANRLTETGHPLPGQFPVLLTQAEEQVMKWMNGGQG